MPSTPPPNDDWPAPTVGALLRLAWMEFRRQADERARLAGFDDLSPSQVLLFRYPTIDGLRPSQLAEQAGMSKQAVNDMLRQLERLGYVGQGERDPADGRARLIALTERGQRLLESLYGASAETANAWAEMLGPERYAQFCETLLMLVRSRPDAGVGEGDAPGSKGD